MELNVGKDYSAAPMLKKLKTMSAPSQLDSILQEHCYSAPIQCSLTKNGFSQPSVPSQLTSEKFEGRIQDLFQLHEATHMNISTIWSWDAGEDDSELNLVGAFEEITCISQYISESPLSLKSLQDPAVERNAFSCISVSPSKMTCSSKEHDGTVRCKLKSIDGSCCDPIQIKGKSPNIQSRSDNPNAHGTAPICFMKGTAVKEGNCDKEGVPFIHLKFTCNKDEQATVSPHLQNTSAISPSQSLQESVISATPDSQRDIQSNSKIPTHENGSVAQSSTYDPVEVISISSDTENDLLQLKRNEDPDNDMLLRDGGLMNVNGSDSDGIVEPPLRHIAKRPHPDIRDFFFTEDRKKPRQELENNPQASFEPKQGFFCQICRKLCPSITALKRHIKRNHSPSDLAALPTPYQEVKCSSCKVEYFMCLHCCRTFYSIKRVIGHTERHHAKICYRCAVCNMKFFISDRWHLLSHSVNPCCTGCHPKEFQHSEIEDNPADSVEAKIGLSLSHHSNKESMVEEQLDLQGPTAVGTDATMLSLPSESMIEEQLEIPDLVAASRDAKAHLALPHDANEKSIVKDITNWDPVVILRPLLPDVVEVGGAIVMGYCEKKPKLNTIDYRKPDQPSLPDANLCTEAPASSDHLRDQVRTTASNSETAALSGAKSSVANAHDTKDIGAPDTQITCEHCGKTFLREKRGMYLAHLEIRHDVDTDHPNKQYECHICDKKFGYLKGLQLHVQAHYMDFKWCKICNKRFRQERTFKMHKCKPVK